MPEWCFTVAGWGLATAAAVLCGWSLLGDRARGRRRCGKCWYDMEGTPGLTCPECGWVAAGERQLFRTRRRHRWGAVAVVLLTVSWLVVKTPEIRRKGWMAAVPSAVLIMLPIDLPDCMFKLNDLPRQRWEQSVWREVATRGYRLRLSGWHLDLLMWRYRGSQWKHSRAVAYDVRDLVPAFPNTSPKPCDFTPDSRWAKDWFSSEWERLVPQLIEHCSWRPNGGEHGDIRSIQGCLFVLAPDDTHQKIQPLLEAMRQAHRAGPNSVVQVFAGNLDAKESMGQGSLQVYNVAEFVGKRCCGQPHEPPPRGVFREVACYPRRAEFADELIDLLSGLVDEEGWIQHGGSRGMMTHYDDLLFIRTTDENHRAIQDLLKRLLPLAVRNHAEWY